MEQLGINAFQLIAQGVNFVILLLVLKKFLYKPVLKLLQSRQQQIAQSAAQAAEVERKIEELEGREKNVLMKAKVKADELVKESRREAKKTSQAILTEAENQLAAQRTQMIENAREEISRMKADFDRLVMKEAVSVANTALKKLLSSETQASLTESQIAKLTKGK